MVLYSLRYFEVSGKANKQGITSDIDSDWHSLSALSPSAFLQRRVLSKQRLKEDDRERKFE